MILNSFYDNLQFVKRYSLHTISAYKSDLGQFVDYLKSGYEIENPVDVSQSMIRSWLASLIEAGQTQSSVNRKLSAVRAYFQYMVRLGKLKTNPASRLNTLKLPKRLPVSASKAEMQKVVHSADASGKVGFGVHRDLLLMELLYSTGIRLSELINLKISDLDHSGLTIRVKGKGNKQRIIPVAPALVSLVDDYLREREKVVQAGVSEIIVTDKGKKTYSMFIYRTVTRYLGEAGVRGRKSPHVLRHTFATHMLNEGADLNAIKELLGHASLAATQVYTHVSVEKLKSIYKLAHPRA